jgi:hypothetical protein
MAIRPQRRQEIEARPRDGLYRTSDLYLAAYLVACGLPLHKTDKSGTRLVFAFKTDDHDVDALKMGWIARTAQISAATYADVIKQLKRLVYEQHE